jgi:hypothetical protein
MTYSARFDGKSLALEVVSKARRDKSPRWGTLLRSLWGRTVSAAQRRIARPRSNSPIRWAAPLTVNFARRSQRNQRADLRAHPALGGETAPEALDSVHRPRRILPGLRASAPMWGMAPTGALHQVFFAATQGRLFHPMLSQAESSLGRNRVTDMQPQETRWKPQRSNGRQQRLRRKSSILPGPSKPARGQSLVPLKPRCHPRFRNPGRQHRCCFRRSRRLENQDRCLSARTECRAHRGRDWTHDGQGRGRDRHIRPRCLEPRDGPGDRQLGRRSDRGAWRSRSFSGPIFAT